MIYSANQVIFWRGPGSGKISLGRVLEVEDNHHAILIQWAKAGLTQYSLTSYFYEIIHIYPSKDYIELYELLHE